MCRTGGRATRARLGLAVGLFCISFQAHARAADPDGSNLSRAHGAYARGAAAFAQGDYTRAARELAAADALVPDGVTLRVAIEAVTLADDPVLGADLLARATRSPEDVALAHAVQVARERFAHRTGTIVVRCDGCLALIDNEPVAVGVGRVVLPGVHLVAVQRKGPPVPRLVTVAVDETREVIARDVGSSHESTANGAASVVPEPDEPRGLSPYWFAGSAAVVVALGAVTVWSAVDTANDHARFENAGCGVSSGPSCQSTASAGQSAQTRTAWLGAATGVAVAGTAALGLFGVRWQRATMPDVALSFRGGGADLRFTF